MEGDAELVFAVFMWIIVLMLIVQGIREYLVRRKLPRNPQDKKIKRAMRKDTIYFFLCASEEIVYKGDGLSDIFSRFTGKLVELQKTKEPQLMIGFG